MLQEKNVKERQIDHWKDIIALQEKMKSNQNKIVTVVDKIEELTKQHKELEEIEKRDVAQEFSFRYPPVSTQSYVLCLLFGPFLG